MSQHPPILAMAGFAARLPLAAAAQQGEWQTPRTPWGDPDIEGIYTNKDESGTPIERSAEFAGRSLAEFDPDEMAALRAARQAAAQALAGRMSE